MIDQLNVKLSNFFLHDSGSNDLTYLKVATVVIRASR